MFSSKIYPQDLPHYYSGSVPVQNGYYYIAVYDPSLKGYTEEIGYLYNERWIIGGYYVRQDELLSKFKKHRIYMFGPKILTPKQANHLSYHLDSCKDTIAVFDFE